MGPNRHLNSIRKNIFDDAGHVPKLEKIEWVVELTGYLKW
jgi:hypothetical protein